MRQGRYGNRKRQRSFNENITQIAIIWITNQVFGEGAEKGYLTKTSHLLLYVIQSNVL